MWPSLVTHPGLIIGVRRIAAFLHISQRTFYHWVHRHGLNAVKLPDGRWAYSPELLHIWLLARYRCVQQQGAGPGRS